MILNFKAESCRTSLIAVWKFQSLARTSTFAKIKILSDRHHRSATSFFFENSQQAETNKMDREWLKNFCAEKISSFTSLHMMTREFQAKLGSVYQDDNEEDLHIDGEHLYFADIYGCKTHHSPNIFWTPQLFHIHTCDIAIDNSHGIDKSVSRASLAIYNSKRRLHANSAWSTAKGAPKTNGRMWRECDSICFAIPIILICIPTLSHQTLEHFIKLGHSV